MADKSQTLSSWIAFRRGLHVAILSGTAAWWALWELVPSGLVPNLAVRFGWSDPILLGRLLFLFLPVGTAFVLHATCCYFDRAFMGRTWTAADVLRLALWRTVSPTFALLLVATGLDSLYGRQPAGIFWLIIAAALTMVASVRLNLAEGIRLKRVKSGELYKRAFAMAKETGIPLKRVYVVPAGRGHLTNAYGLGESIAVTDNFGKFLDQPELDFVIGHELGHVKAKHGRKRLLILPTIFTAFAIVCFLFPPALIRFRFLLDLFLLLIPVLTFYFFSRRFEYAAD
jgi:Zn-dependent protease with chaperone function